VTVVAVGGTRLRHARPGATRRAPRLIVRRSGPSTLVQFRPPELSWPDAGGLLRIAIGATRLSGKEET
jgi:hypothetical protein